jgi:hypothetical protein
MGEKTAATIKTTNRIGAYIKLAVTAVTALGAIAGVIFGIYMGWQEVKKSNKVASNQAEHSKALAKGAYAALASKLDALAQRVAYLEGKMDGREVRIIRSHPPAAHMRPMLYSLDAPASDEVEVDIEESPEEVEMPFRDGVRFEVGAYQDLPDDLEDLVQTQEQYQAD